MNHEKERISTVSEYNQRVLLAADILTGREYRRYRRSGKLSTAKTRNHE